MIPLTELQAMLEEYTAATMEDWTEERHRALTKVARYLPAVVKELIEARKVAEAAEKKHLAKWHSDPCEVCAALVSWHAVCGGKDSP